MTKLRVFQQVTKDAVNQAWADHYKDVMMVLPTGGGKTVIFSSIMQDERAPSIAIAHRQEIVSQISLALARNGIMHRIIGSKSVAATCRSLHLNELKRNFVDPRAPVAVAGVDTLVRMDPNDPFFKSVSLVIQDEGHHLLRKNKWGRAREMFTNARLLSVTATPCRADGQGLGRHADGVIDKMILGPDMRTLINEGWLTEYQIYAPESDLDLTQVPITDSGDFSPLKLAVAVHKSHIMGDVVNHYLKLAAGKLGITFAVDVAAAGEIAAAFRQAGVPSEVVSAKTPDALRQSILNRFRRREVLQLVNVDLFGEGFDLPAIEVVSMARPTESFSLYSQQFGRALRPMDGKDHAIIIDHVGNVHRHKLPEYPHVWSLDRRERRSKNANSCISTRTCVKCLRVYEAYKKSCPYCGHEPIPSGRSTPEQVDGDLSLLEGSALALLQGRIDAAPVFPYSAGPEVIGSIKKHHRIKGETQQALRQAMAMWAGRQSQATDERTVCELQRKFYLTFGIDVLSAQALGRQDAEALMGRMAC
jgi:superfamily II DNA or RNA helicase